MLNIRWEDSHVAVHSFGRPATNVSMAAFAAAKSVGLLTITAKVNAPPFNRDTLPVMEVTSPRLPVFTRISPASSASFRRL